MTFADLQPLLPFIILAVAAVAVMLASAFSRDRGVGAGLTLVGIVLAAFALITGRGRFSPLVAQLAMIDQYAVFFFALVLFAAFVVAVFSMSYLSAQEDRSGEYYVLLLTATLGAGVLTASVHFASFFLGLELLSISLYAMVAYLRTSGKGLEAGVKYLILAAVSSAFILFGMALVYAETGTMEFLGIAARSVQPDVRSLPLAAGTALLLAGIGFKLAVVPFHFWTPDVYEGAPAPVTAFVATVSKGAVFAAALRYFGETGVPSYGPLFTALTFIAAASMFAGNLLALLQRNVKRVLAYSSISHMGYLLVAFLAAGPLGELAAALYLTAYIITALGAFGVVSVLSVRGRDADSADDYRGLAWRKPWLAAVFTAMLLSLAGMPLTAGFVGKFYLTAAGVDSSLWFLVAALIVNSVLGLYYYLRLVAALFSPPGDVIPLPPSRPPAASGALAALLALLLWLGLYPGPVIAIIKEALGG